MPQVETVYLDDMDGFEFEHLCERIFQKSDWGDVERIGGVADGGRDLLIHKPGGESIVVECKHHPNSSVGRPVVQKLHSVVVSSGAVKGIIVTTGRYSNEAIQHAKLLSETVPIELIDRYGLVSLAQKAGIKMVIASHNTTIFSFPAPDMPMVSERISDKIAEFESSPSTASELLRVIPNSFRLDAVYVVTANIHQDFTTSVGEIHSIHQDDVSFLVNAQTGKIVDGAESEFLNGCKLVNYADIPKTACVFKSTDFVTTVTDLKSKAVKHIIQKFTAKITYRGRNNVSYTKTCTPGPRSIQISDIKQAFLPRYDLSIRFLKSTHPCRLINNDSDIFMSTDLYECRICKKDTGDRALLCNSCGSTSHRPKFWNSHGFVCKNCKKTVCKNCTFWHRRLMFFKKILCESCADSKPNSKRRLVKIRN